MSLGMLLVAGLLSAIGCWLILSRQLTRIVLGVGLLGHGINLVLVLSGGDGGTPAFDGQDASRFGDPLPQAMVLTAIVITLGVISFLLALAFRAWSLGDDDAVPGTDDNDDHAADSDEWDDGTEPAVPVTEVHQ